MKIREIRAAGLRGNTAVGLAADLQLPSALPTTEFVEYLTGSPFIDELSLEEWKLEPSRTLPIPELPGLGVRIDLDSIEALSGAKPFLD